MLKRLDLNWNTAVQSALQNGCLFERWRENGVAVEYEADVSYKVDENGFFIYWKSTGENGNAIELSQVSDIRTGVLPTDKKVLAELQKKHGDKLEDRSLMICIGTNYVDVSYECVVCPHVKTAKIWAEGLRKLIHNNKVNNCCPMTSLKKHWLKLTLLVNSAGKIPVNTVARPFASDKSEKFIYECLAEVGLPSYKNHTIDPKYFAFNKFYEFYHKVCPRSDIEELFKSVAQEEEHMSVEQFITFLNQKQRDPQLNEIIFPLYNKKRASEIIHTYEIDEVAKKKNRFTKEGFFRYLMSDDNAPVLLDQLDNYMDMDQSLSAYYINSSHNTYLTGGQFVGKSSVEMCRQVLLAGCRCIELDCHDRKADDEPVITHGKSMCNVILFKDVIYAVRDSAFATSEYPVILSLENHCSTIQQYKMARYLVEILGDMLLKEPLKDYPLVPGVQLPSPNALKRKILIKNKKLKPEVERDELELFKKGQLYFQDFEEEPDFDHGSFLDISDSPAIEGESPQVAERRIHVHPWLSSMVNYIHPVKFECFEMSEAENISHHMSSLSENTAYHYSRDQAIEFVDYNKRQISRVYPKGTRTGSSNFMPQDFWNMGCQIVALNFQTADLSMQLNQGKFEYNGNCGYLLKPHVLRRINKKFDPFAECPVDGVVAIQCSVQVISGQFLSDRMVGTYVEVDMYGLPTDTVRKTFRTKTIPMNGLNPVYNEGSFIFRKVVLPELAVLRFGVYDDYGKFLGQRILPLEGLQNGFRHISLRSEENFPMTLAMLFCKIEMKIYVPDGLNEMMAALTNPQQYHGASRAPSLELNNLATDIPKCNLRNKDECKNDYLIFQSITLESVSSQKFFRKMVKRHRKEYHQLKKKLRKDLMALQKEQCLQIHKKFNKKCQVNERMVTKIVTEQTIQLINLMWEQRKIMRDFISNHLEEQTQMYKTCIETLQTAQMQQLAERHQKEKQKLNSSQARFSLDISKEIENDSSLKTKRDREGRLREKQQKNTKQFVEEQRHLDTKHSREMQILKSKHEEELNKSVHDVGTLNLYRNEEIEYKMWRRSEFFTD